MKLIASLLSALLCTAALSAEVALDAAADSTKKTQVTDSMIGFRDTLRFYEFAEEKAILLVRIDNRDTKFAITAKLFLFEKDTTAEGMGKWINNQHSDGLFIDAAEPRSSHDIPAAALNVKSHEIAEQVDAQNGKFTRYTVTFEIKEMPPLADFKIKDFTDKATVNVKTAGG